MKNEQKRIEEYFDGFMKTMPDREGFDKWVCGDTYHVDTNLWNRLDTCPSCKQKYQPLTGYSKKRDSSTK